MIGIASTVSPYVTTAMIFYVATPALLTLMYVCAMLGMTGITSVATTICFIRDGMIVGEAIITRHADGRFTVDYIPANCTVVLVTREVMDKFFDLLKTSEEISNETSATREYR